MEEEFVDIGQDGQILGGTVVADLDEGDEGMLYFMYILIMGVASCHFVHLFDSPVSISACFLYSPYRSGRGRRRIAWYRHGEW